MYDNYINRYINRIYKYRYTTDIYNMFLKKKSK